LTEYELHKAVIANLRLRAVPDLFYWHTPNSGRRTMGEISGLRQMGFVAGIPDLFFLHRGKLSGLELKTLKGKATSDQLLVVDRIEKAGGQAEISYGLDHALGCLEAWGLIRAEVKA